MSHALPFTMWDAIAATRSAEILPRYLGKDYPAMYAAVKQGELNSFMAKPFRREFDWYL